jgi:hypothetical protein
MTRHTTIGRVGAVLAQQRLGQHRAGGVHHAGRGFITGSFDAEHHGGGGYRRRMAKGSGRPIILAVEIGL